jgi:hypothetical protein
LRRQRFLNASFDARLAPALLILILIASARMRLLSEQTLNDKKVAILVADGIEKVGLTEPKKTMAQKG